MRDTDAVILDNWFPSAADVMLRKGSASHVTGITGDVETLAAYRPMTGSEVLFAWAGTSAFNVSSAGAVGAAVLTGLSNARWQHSNFKTSAGNFLLCVNGADSLRAWDGAAWATITGASVPAITGLTTSSIISLNVHQQRVWYIPANSMSAYYTAAGACFGAVTEFPLGAVFKKGGYLMAMGTWTIDAGDGSDDRAVFISSQGEVAIYSGTDPASASTFGLIGVYAIGAPIGRRCLCKRGGDLLILTESGLIPCSQLTSAADKKTAAITDAIQTAMADAVKLYGSNFGWDVTLYPGGDMLLLNVPIADALQQQFVMNTVTRAWCRFKPLGTNPGWPAWCFEIFNGALYFGCDSGVRKAWTGTADVSIAIEAEVLPAFNYFGSMNAIKEFKLVRPVIGWDSNPAQILIGTDVDFITETPTSEITLPTSSGGVWDSGTWDSGTWGGDIGYNRDWYGCAGVGFAGALHMRVKSAAAIVRLVAISYLFELGEVL